MVNEESVQRFCEHVDLLNIASWLDADLSSNPNHNYHVLDDSIKTRWTSSYRRELYVLIDTDTKCLVGLHTQGLIRSIQNRDRLYRRLKETKPNSPFLHEREYKLQPVNKILKQSIRLAKKMYYVSRFEYIVDDARKMWENIRMFLHNTKKSAQSPLHFFVDNKIESDGLKIANEFDKYFTNIGTDLANNIPNTDENYFRRHLLCMHCESPCSFNYTSSGDASKLISKLEIKNSAGHDRMSTKLLRKIDLPFLPLCHLS